MDCEKKLEYDGKEESRLGKVSLDFQPSPRPVLEPGPHSRSRVPLLPEGRIWLYCFQPMAVGTSLTPTRIPNLGCSKRAVRPLRRDITCVQHSQVDESWWKGKALSELEGNWLIWTESPPWPTICAHANEDSKESQFVCSKGHCSDCSE